MATSPIGTQHWREFAQALNVNTRFILVFNYFIDCSAGLEKCALPPDAGIAFDWKTKRLWEEYSKFKQLKTGTEAGELLLEMFMSRNVDALNLFVVRLLTDAYKTQPNALLAFKEKVDLKDVVLAADKDEIIMNIIDRVVHQLSYKGLQDLRDELAKLHKLTITFPEKDFEDLKLCFGVRNIIVHNGRRVNNHFIKSTGYTTLQPGALFPLTVDWVMDTGTELVQFAHALDSAFIAQFNLPAYSPPQTPPPNPS